MRAALALMTLMMAAQTARAVFTNEEPCIIQGGICTMKEDCPPKSLSSVPGLCPNQQSMGVECCYDLPLSAKTCQSRGGECMAEDDCHQNNDRYSCPEGTKCCILVNK